jgi:hypothetical protein
MRGKASGRSSVLRLADPNSDTENTFVFVVRFYRPNIVAVEVTLKTPFPGSLRDAFQYRPLNAHKAAHAVVDSLIGIVKGGSAKHYPRDNSFFSRPAILISKVSSERQFETWKNANKSIIADLLINNPAHDMSSPNLADIIFERNKDIDIKFANVAFSLVSKQGVVTAYANLFRYMSEHIRDEHKKRFRFLEFSLALREFVSEFTNIRHHNEDVSDFLLYLGRPLISESAIIPRTTTGTYIWHILSKELGFDIVSDEIESSILTAIDKKTKYFAAIPPSEYDSLNFAEQVSSAMRPFHRTWLERSYERHKAIFWIIGAAIAAAGVAAQVLFS